MRRFTDAVRQALTQKNWHAALHLSLTLPDICAGLESDNWSTNGPRYAAWFDRYVGERYKHVLPHSGLHVFLSGSDAYALRCAALHEGGADITHQKAREALDRFHFTTGGAHCNQFNSVLQLNVETFCNDVCAGVERWLADFRAAHPDKLARLDELLTIHEGPSSPMPGVRLG